MSTDFLFGISLTASFLAGALALFAPCCITFLFPSYLGTVFKSRNKVMFYTIIFALGLSSVLIPVALGFRALIFFFDQFHREIYYLGGLFLILMGITTMKPILDFSFLSRLLPQADRQPRRLSGGLWQSSVSVFSLGLMSGLSSSCCAPVLFAAVTLTSLSPTLFQALIVSSAYVLGIVFPLFLMSLFYEKLTTRVSGKNRQKIYEVFKILGAGIFILSGIGIIIANFYNKIQMYQMEGYTRPLRMIVFNLGKYFQNPIVDIVTFVAILVISYLLLVKKNRLR
ncbi:MAG: Cytochrome c biogenesis protein transmembrane region [Candidatus Roizmanbacteria bacterium GW2011_GWC2_37_13]|uniref:Cytochrome c biogenesis protein transmembrane region n=1 Tax=Candidatus Roizmanbacteria bacterium GW2011_GWC2_37_13 TaxID=1618486 RepID=A0A0G0G064_9BACT|nr:MAG: Cytochrome c biogenesis protein transmembrane region [Candidatus Roizmanbacteria bacterium GW2011_GWC1_37_12]KKQ24583.1 MAG: Cytochrome c biogenesis protein transmembrane region [Candidatus Roizmanbacteria bacterium GW2011_GWC2_37_13]